MTMNSGLLTLGSIEFQWIRSLGCPTLAQIYYIWSVVSGQPVPACVCLVNDLELHNIEYARIALFEITFSTIF